MNLNASPNRLRSENDFGTGENQRAPPIVFGLTEESGERGRNRFGGKPKVWKLSFLSQFDCNPGRKQVTRSGGYNSVDRNGGDGNFKITLAFPGPAEHGQIEV